MPDGFEAHHQESIMLLIMVMAATETVAPEHGADGHPACEVSSGVQTGVAAHIKQKRECRPELLHVSSGVQSLRHAWECD